jgi:myosin-crossreactive antigen
MLISTSHPDGKQASRIHWRRDGIEGGVDLGPEDLLFMTIDSLTENSDNGDHHTPAKLNVVPEGAINFAFIGQFAESKERDCKEIEIPGSAFLRNLLMNKIDKTQIGVILHEFGIIADD